MTVYANGLEIACKAQANQVIAAFPDVCFTPPENPATPPGVPVPYPSFGVDSDTDKGTGSVKIGGETVSQKNLSYYTKTTGTEAGSAAKKGIVTSKNTGKSYNEAWSNNVKMDGEPVSRFSDLSTNNHASPQGNSLPICKIGKPKDGVYKRGKCLVGSHSKIKKECAARGGEAHHIIPDMVYRGGTRRGTNKSNRMKGAPSIGKGMCVCVTPQQHDGLHSHVNGAIEKKGIGKSPKGTAKIKELAAVSIASLKKIKPKLTPKECQAMAAKMARDQAKPLSNKKGRATVMPPAKGSAAYKAITRG